MKGKSIYKIPNGKLLKIFLDYDKEKNLINNVNITGDFFAYPEESIDILENELKNINLNERILLDKINQVVNINSIQFIGIGSEDLTKGIMMCIK